MPPCGIHGANRGLPELGRYNPQEPHLEWDGKIGHVYTPHRSVSPPPSIIRRISCDWPRTVRRKEVAEMAGPQTATRGSFLFRVGRWIYVTSGILFCDRYTLHPDTYIRNCVSFLFVIVDGEFDFFGGALCVGGELEMLFSYEKRRCLAQWTGRIVASGSCAH